VNIVFGVGYAPHMFGSGPNSWYTHRLGIRLNYEEPTNEMNYPFDRVPFNLNNELLKYRDSDNYKRRVLNDLIGMRAMGIRLVRVHVYPATHENLAFLKWIASLCKMLNMKLMVDLVKERPEHWFKIDPEMCGVYARELKGDVDIWQIMNETNFVKDPAPIISSFKEAAEQIRKADSKALICLNNAGFNREFNEKFIKKGVEIDVLGLDYYPAEGDEPRILEQCRNLREFHKDYPDIKLIIDEFGVHPKKAVKYSTSRIEFNGKIFDRNARLFLREIGEIIDAFISFWYQDLLVFRAKKRADGTVTSICYHQLVNLDRTPTPMGKAYSKIIQEYAPECHVDLSLMPKIRRGKMIFNDELPPISGVEYHPSIKEVGEFLETLDSPLIVVGENLNANFYECGMFLAKTLSYFLKEQPEERTDVEVKKGIGKGKPCIFIGNEKTNIFLRESGLHESVGSRRGTVTLIDLSGEKVLVIDGSDDDGVIAATLDLVRRYWHAEGSPSPEIAFS